MQLRLNLLEQLGEIDKVRRCVEATLRQGLGPRAPAGRRERQGRPRRDLVVALLAALLAAGANKTTKQTIVSVTV